MFENLSWNGCPITPYPPINPSTGNSTWP